MSKAMRHPFGPWTSKGLSPPAPGEPLFVSGFGAVLLGTGQEEPRIQVRLTAFRCPSEWDPGLPIPEQLDPQRCWWDAIPVGLLPHVHVGQIWLDGTCQSLPGYEYHEFEINVDPDVREDGPDPVLVWEWQGVRVRENPRLSVPLITSPVFQVAPVVPPGYRWHKRTPGVRYLRFRSERMDREERAVRVLVSCVEVARKYYLNSSKLAYAVCTGFHASAFEPSSEPGRAPRHLDELYNPEMSTVREDGYPWVRLRMRIDDEDALTVGRFRYDDLARREGLRMGASILRREHEKQVPVMEAHFPFKGRTRLGVYGTWISSEAEGLSCRHFLVFWIASCSGPWPFRELHFDRDNDGRESLGEQQLEEEDDGAGGSPPRAPRPIEGQYEPIWPDAETSLLSGLVKTRLSPTRFNPDRPVKAVKPPRKDEGGTTRWQKPGPAEEVNSVNTGPGGSKQTGVGRLNLVREQPATDPEPPQDRSEPPVHKLEWKLELFERAVRRLAHEKQWVVSWWSPPRGDMTGNAVALPVQNLRDKQPAWCWIDRAENRRRHALVAEISVGEATVYVIEVERRRKENFKALVLADSHGEPLEDAVLWRVLERCVKRGSARNRKDAGGIWGQKPGSTGLYHQPIQHSRSPEASREEKEGGVETGEDEWAQKLVESFAKYLARHVLKAVPQGPRQGEEAGKRRRARNQEPERTDLPGPEE